MATTKKKTTEKVEKVEVKENKKKEVKKDPHMKYNKRIKIVIVAIIILLSIATGLLYYGTSLIKKNSVSYQENSNVDYKVYLKDNNYYEDEYLGKDMQYIASLIDHIDVTFKYSFAADDEVNSDFTYYITGDVYVYDTDTAKNTIYHREYKLTEEETLKIENSDATYLEKSITIDYAFYNNTIKAFKNDYNLLASSDIQLTLHITSNGKSISDIPITTNNDMTLTIPLTEQTINVAMNYTPINNIELVQGENKLIINNTVIVIGSAVTFVIALIAMIYVIILYSKTTRKKTKYEIYLRKLLKEYDRLIAETKDINIEEDASIIELKSFGELLDIRDNLQLPILFFEIKEGQKAWFVVKNNDEYYRYILNAVDLESE